VKEFEMVGKTIVVAVVSAVAAVAAFPSGACVSVSPNLFANVSAPGALLSGNGVSSVSHVGTGQYEVTFVSGVSQCAYLATTMNAFSQAITVFTAGGHGGPNGVYVETKNQGGGLTDGPFGLVVICGGAASQFAVIGYSANLVRSTPGAALTHLGAGRYRLSFPAAVNRCAYLATVGDPGKALVFSPAGVYTGSGLNANTVYVETKNPGGGLSDGIPFHLAALCPSAVQVYIAVVRSSGLIARGSGLTSSFKASTGNYVFVTKVVIDACAVIATRGSVNTAVPFNPATVERTSGPAPNTSGIQVRALLFFGGGLGNEAFHTAAVC
jgi:hypothetical protein